MSIETAAGRRALMGIATEPNNDFTTTDGRNILMFLAQTLVFDAPSAVVVSDGGSRFLKVNRPKADPAAGGVKAFAAIGAVGVGGAAVRPRGAWIAGIPLMHSQTIRWAMREGVEPVIEEFDIDRRFIPHFRNFIADHKPVELVIVSNETVARFRDLFIVGIIPSSNRHLAAVQVADRRWMWSSRICLRRMNIRRKTGQRRVVNPARGGARPDFQIDPVLDRTGYARYSLANPEAPNPNAAKWRARAALLSVLRDAMGAEAEVRGVANPAPLVVPAALGAGDRRRAAPIENIELDDRAHEAVARMLEYIPGARLMIDADGKVVVYQAGSNRDQTMRARALPEKENKGHSELADMSPRRPSSVRVFFTYEVEVRFDYLSEGSGGGTTVVVMTERQRELQRRMKNVLDIPDAFLDVNAMVNDAVLKTRYAQGNWVPIDANLFTAWGAPLTGAPILTDKVVRQAFIPYVGMWEHIVAMGVGTPDADWAARVSKLVQHWRRTFQLPARWVDRALSIEAYRVATIDRATGQRAPASAYTDYWVIPSRRSFHTLGDAQNKARANFGGPVFGYPGPNAWKVDSKPAPFDVRIHDADQGIIGLEWTPHPSLLETEVLMGTLSGNRVPSGNIGNLVAGPPGWDIVYASSQIPQIDPDWGLATILTLVPAAPNDTSQLFMIEVHPAEVRDLVHPHVAQRLGADHAHGPPWEVRIPRAEETARVAWDDTKANQIGRLFGIGTVEGDRRLPPDQRRQDARDRANEVRDLIVNLGADRAGAASLEELARAAAAGVYTRWADRVLGQMEGHLKPGLVAGIGNTVIDPAIDGGGVGPAGALSEVSFELHPNGEGSVQISFPDQVVPQQLWSFLDDGTRKILMRVAGERET